MSACDDVITILETLPDASSVEVISYGGDDIITLGDLSRPLDANIFCNIIVDGGFGDDILVIQDEGSTLTKSVSMRSTLLTGLHGSNGENIAYFEIETIDARLGHTDADVNIFYSTAKNAHVILTTHEGDDTIQVHSARGPLTIDSGEGDDYFPIESTKGNITVTSQSGAKNLTIQEVLGDVSIDLQGSGEDVIHLFEVEGSLDIKTWDDNDLITLDKFRGSLFFDTGDGEDIVEINHLEDGNGTVLGGDGDDLLLLDARGDSDRLNTMDGSHLDWNGGEGDDMVEMYFVSSGTTNLNIFGDNSGVNQVKARCIDEICNMLSRKTFLANIHYPESSESSIERINLHPTANLYDLHLSLNGGDNTMFFDDTFCIYDVIGGDGNESFHIGQLYNDSRITAYGISPIDPITTTLTARGYLSDGCSHPVTLNGGKWKHPILMSCFFQ